MMLDESSLAKLRILVAVAKADGRLDAMEQKLLVDQGGKDNAELLTGLLEDDIDVDAEVAKLDEAARRELYHAAYAMTHADGHASVEEVALLDRIVSDDGEASLAAQIWGEAADTLVPGRILPVADPAQRDAEITEDILKYATLAAVAGATPLPGVGVVADLAVIALQTKLVHDVARYTGQHTTEQTLRDFLGGVLGSTALRIGINQLARLVPIAGSIWGASTSFASTYAVGRVAQRYFEGGQQLSDAELKGLFETAAAEGKQRFTERRADVTAATESHESRLLELAEKLEQGQISRAAYERAVHELTAA